MINTGILYVSVKIRREKDSSPVYGLPTHVPINCVSFGLLIRHFGVSIFWPIVINPRVELSFIIIHIISLYIMLFYRNLVDIQMFYALEVFAYTVSTILTWVGWGVSEGCVNSCRLAGLWHSRLPLFYHNVEHSWDTPAGPCHHNGYRCTDVEKQSPSRKSLPELGRFAVISSHTPVF